jgi:branched-chain amino acid transport system permease protein
MGFFLNFISLRGVFGSFDDIFFAAILVIIMLFMPQGLIRLKYFETLRAKFLKRRKVS